MIFNIFLPRDLAFICYLRLVLLPSFLPVLSTFDVLLQDYIPSYIADHVILCHTSMILSR